MCYKKMAALLLAAMAAGACKDDDGISPPAAIPPLARIRFVNAIADTGTVDMLFVDRVENLPSFIGVAFRSSSGVYQGITPGQRAVRIFPNSSSQAEASKRLIDTTITLNANARYTLVYGGSARGNADRLSVIEETFDVPTATANNIMVKTIHADVSMGGAANVYVANDGATDPVAQQVAVMSNVPLFGRSNYVTVPARTGTGLYTFAVTPAATTTATYSATPNQPGAAAPADNSYGPQPGVRISGSVLTAVLFPAATAGSPSAASTASRVLLLVDKPLNP